MLLATATAPRRRLSNREDGRGGPQGGPSRRLSPWKVTIVSEYLQTPDRRPKFTHVFAKAEGLHYVEPGWCSARLFQVEQFPGSVWDPFCGWGRVVEAARAAGYAVRASDIADRGYPLDAIEDFLTVRRLAPDVSIVGNPPFTDAIARHAIGLNPIKMALIWPFARIVAAWPWLAAAPLAHVWMMTPRPAMPPASYIAAGLKPKGARVEHAWLVFARSHRGPAQLGWLRREVAP